MHADIDTLLRGAGGDPPTPSDLGDIWRAGRRRRRRRRVSAVAGGLGGLVAVVALVGGGLTSGVPLPTIDAVEPAAPSAPVEPVPVEEGDAPGAGDAAGDREPVGAVPDAALVEDPCAPRDPAATEAFIDVVAPVDGQVVEGPVAVVGCARVPEGTVRYRVLDARSGGVLADGFATASAGGPGLGEFRFEVDLPAGGPVTLEVFWDSPAGDGERDLGTVGFEVR